MSNADNFLNAVKNNPNMPIFTLDRDDEDEISDHVLTNSNTGFPNYNVKSASLVNRYNPVG